MSWQTMIEFPSRKINLNDVFDTLTGYLEIQDIEEMAEELFCFVGKRIKKSGYAVYVEEIEWNWY